METLKLIFGPRTDVFVGMSHFEMMVGGRRKEICLAKQAGPASCKGIANLFTGVISL